MKIYLTRHGETLWNKEGKMQGCLNSELTEQGIVNAKKLGESLKDIDFDCIYSSPLGRAYETAEYIRGDKENPIVIKQWLKNMSFGIWEGMEIKKINEYASEEYYDWNKADLYLPIKGGESYQQLIKRVGKGLEEIIKSNPGDTILLVTHSAVIKAIFTLVKNLPLEEFWNPPALHNNCLSILEISGDRMELTLEADITCLE